MRGIDVFCRGRRFLDADVYEEHSDVHGELFELLPVTNDDYAEALKTLVAKYN